MTASTTAPQAALNRYLIVLSDGDGTVYRLCPAAVGPWLEAPVNFSRTSGYSEPVPDDVKAQALEQELECPLLAHVTVGSWQNDRALVAPGLDFASVSELFAHLQAHGLTLDGEFQGLSY